VIFSWLLIGLVICFAFTYRFSQQAKKKNVKLTLIFTSQNQMILSLEFIAHLIFYQNIK